MATERQRVDRLCAAAFGLGILSLACAMAGACSWWNLLLLAGSTLWILTLIAGAAGIIRMAGHRGTSGGSKLALWGMGLPTGWYGLMAFLIWQFPPVRDNAHFVAVNNLTQIALGFHYHQEVHKRLPPAAICDAAGKPLLSWRVAILPFVEQEALFEEFKLDEPWDSPHNIALLERMPFLFQIPYRDADSTSSTFFQVFVGPGTPFEADLVCKIPESFPDGTSNTLLVVEAAEAVPWTKPEDLRYHPDRPLPRLGGAPPRIRFGLADFLGFGRPPVKQVLVALADGSVRRLSWEAISEQTRRRAIVRNDGPEMGPDW